MATFTFDLSPSTRYKVTPRVNTAKLGDGYAQRSPDGLNHRLKVVNISIQRRTNDYLDLVEGFIVDNDTDTVPFLFTPPGPSAVQGNYICSSYDRPFTSGVTGDLTAIFEEQPF